MGSLSLSGFFLFFFLIIIIFILLLKKNKDLVGRVTRVWEELKYIHLFLWKQNYPNVKGKNIKEKKKKGNKETCKNQREFLLIKKVKMLFSFLLHYSAKQ